MGVFVFTSSPHTPDLRNLFSPFTFPKYTFEAFVCEDHIYI